MSPRSFPKKAAGHDVQDAISWHASALLMLFVFVILTSFAIALWVLKLQLKQQDLTTAVNVTAYSAMRSATPAVKTEATEQTTGAKDLFVDYLPCKQGYVGNCDDFVLFRKYEGRKVVIIPSMRAVFPGVYLPKPVANSHHAQYLVMSPSLVYDGYAPEIAYTYLFDTATGNATRVTLPATANVSFSADNLYAAYVKEEKKDYRDVVVLDLKKDTSKTVSTAKSGESFWNGTDIPLPKAVSATSVTFDVFTSSDVTHATSSLKEMRTIEFKF